MEKILTIQILIMTTINFTDSLKWTLNYFSSDQTGNILIKSNWWSNWSDPFDSSHKNRLKLILSQISWRNDYGKQILFERQIGHIPVCCSAKTIIKIFTMYYEVTNYSSPFTLDNTKRQDAGVYLNAMIVTKVTISDLWWHHYARIFDRKVNIQWFHLAMALKGANCPRYVTMKNFKKNFLFLVNAFHYHVTNM